MICPRPVSFCVTNLPQVVNAIISIRNAISEINARDPSHRNNKKQTSQRQSYSQSFSPKPYTYRNKCYYDAQSCTVCTTGFIK